MTPDKTGSSVLAQLDGHSPGFPCDGVKQHANTRGQCGFTKNHRKRSRSCFDYELLKHPGAKVKSLIKRRVSLRKKKKLLKIVSSKASRIAVKIAFQHLCTAERSAVLFAKEFLQICSQYSCLIFPILCLRNLTSPQLARIHTAGTLLRPQPIVGSPPSASLQRTQLPLWRSCGSLEGNSNRACVLFPAQQPPGVCPPLTPKDERSKVCLHLPPAQLFNLLTRSKGTSTVLCA